MSNRALAARSGKFTNFREAEKIGHNRLAAPILVRAVAMQPITTATGVQVNQGQRQIIAAEKPGECARRVCPPLEMAVGTPGRKTGRNRRCGLQRLLIERLWLLALLAEPVRTDRPKQACGRRLPCHEPAQGSETGLDIAGRSGRISRYDQRLG